METIEKVEKLCCGCGSCVQKCPKNAIEMKENSEGFLYPFINKEKCVNCGICKKGCPILSYQINKNDFITLAAKNKDIESLKKSSSGGMFDLLSKYVIKYNGIVFGAAYTDEFGVEHVGVEKEEDLVKLRGSKYIQSDTKKTYSEVLKFLKEGRMVLYVGTPCQIAGLKCFLGKTFENLITCDLICHGVPSQKLFKDYIKFLEKKYKAEVIKYNFRSKEKKGWSLNAEILLKTGKKKYINSDFDRYYSNFLNCNTYRESCYNCKFANMNRTGDFTLGDYWGILSIHNDFYDKNGVSLFIINTKKGKDIFKNICNNLKYIETDINYAASRNKNLIRPSIRPQIRDYIYDDVNKNGIKKGLRLKISLKNMAKLIIPSGMKKYIMKLVKR